MGFADSESSQGMGCRQQTSRGSLSQTRAHTTVVLVYFGTLFYSSICLFPLRQAECDTFNNLQGLWTIRLKNMRLKLEEETALLPDVQIFASKAAPEK